MAEDWQASLIRLLKHKGPMKWEEVAKKCGVERERLRVSEIRLKDDHLLLDAFVHADETPWVRTVMKRLQERDGLKWTAVQTGLEGVTKKKLGLLPELFAFDKAKHHVFFDQRGSRVRTGRRKKRLKTLKTLKKSMKGQRLALRLALGARMLGLSG